MKDWWQNQENKMAAMCLGFVFLLSYLTYVYNYSFPAELFWDENYHIASAQKYLNGIFFMELHPPLGKMLIAFGEYLLQPNAEFGVDQFVGTDYGREIPEGFSFAGYRLFPVLLAWLTAPVLYGIFLIITRRPVFATLLSFLYIFDNALIVHSRGAMLEGTLLFTCALTTLAFLLLLHWKDDLKKFLYASIGFGVSFGLVMSTKLLGLIMILLIPALVVALWGRWRQLSRFAGASALAFLIVYCSVWMLHFSIGKNLQPQLNNGGYYQASDEYRRLIDTGKHTSLTAFPTMLSDSLQYGIRYNEGVPRLNLCKPDENGSPPYFWPVGARTINYRWETPDSVEYRYLYIVANPVVWWSSFVAVLIGAAMLLLPQIVQTNHKLKQPFLLLVFVGMYTSYMIAVLQLDRVMYIYHYFTPLFFSFIVAGLVFNELTHIASIKLDEHKKLIALVSFSACIFASYQFYRPLSYYLPVTNEQVERRSLLPVWDLRCVNCERQNGIATPR